MITFTPKQARFAEAVFEGPYRYLLFGGAIRGGKTVCALSLVVVLAKIYSGSRWAVVRKDLPTLKRNTIPSFGTIAPSNFVGQVNKTDWYVDCTNGSRIMFFAESAKEDPALNRWRGLEVNGFVLEEANELTEAAFNKAIERAGSWRCQGQQPAPLILATCNPSQGWVRRVWYDDYKRGALRAPWFYLPSRITDNPHLDPQYLESLKSLQRTDPVAYRRFVEGDWEVSDDPDQLIKYDWLLAAKNVKRVDGKSAMGVDIARYGDDSTVICHTVGNAITSVEYHNGLSLERTTAIVRARINDIPVDAGRVLIDGVGLGAGVVDNLRADGYRPVELISGARAVVRGKGKQKAPERFRNLRSQMWWNARELFRRGLVCLEAEDQRLMEDLTAPRYTVTADRLITVESKDQIKKRIGRSTDAGDAVVYALAREIKLGKVERIKRMATWAKASG